ncbi:MAG: hypothetical protein ACUVRC_10405 [Desulfotomaculales bacterium]
MSNRPDFQVVPLRPEDPGDIFSVIRSWGYEIYVGDELCEGDVLEVVGRLRGEAANSNGLDSKLVSETSLES